MAKTTKYNQRKHTIQQSFGTRNHGNIPLIKADLIPPDAKVKMKKGRILIIA